MRSYGLMVSTRRTLHVTFNELSGPEPTPKETDYASVIDSDVPIVVQHSALDPHQATNALLCTRAYARNE